MNTSRAHHILKCLIQGQHPNTGEDLPPDTILQNADVLRALLVASNTLEAAAARTARRAQLPHNVGKSWDTDEEQALTAAFKGGTSIADLAKTHGRTLRAIQARLHRLGLIAEFDSLAPSAPTE